jgi:iron complex outermembrane receptor protein
MFFTVPFEMSIGTEMAFDTYRFHYFETYTFLNPIKEVKGVNLVLKKQNSSYKLLCWFDFSPNWHLETGLAFKHTQYALEDFFGTAPASQQFCKRFCHHEQGFL